MSRPLFRPQPVAHLVAVVLALALLADAAGAAPTAEALGRVEAAIRRVAVEATPKTVCVRIDRGGKAAGFGSGAIVSADGLVLTCAHVTEPAADGGRLVAVLPDGTEVGLSLVASNAKNDLSLCRLVGERRDWPAYTLAPTDPAVGDWVVALGHPGGPFADHQPTVAAGKVTAVGRSLPLMLQGKAYVGALQTDVPLFGGNSGGPLVDLEGRLAGINGAMLMVGDAAFAVAASRIARDLPALSEGKPVEGDDVGDLFSAMSDLASDLDPDALAEAFADDNLREVMRAVGSMQGMLGRDDHRKARRRGDDLGEAFPGPYAPAAEVLADGRRVAFATAMGVRGGRALFLTTSRAGTATGELRVRRAAGPGASAVDAVARVRGVDGEWDLALLDVATDAADEPAPAPAAAGSTTRGSFVVVPDASGRPTHAGVVAALGRTVGTERRVPTIGIVRLFQPAHTSPFRPYPAMTQVDAPFEADELGAPVLRPDGTLVGVAVAHFHGGATMVVPATVLAARVARLLDGIDSAAPPSYGPPPRPAPDRAARAARATARRRDADAVVLYVPTLAGVLRPAKLLDPEAGGDGPTAATASGGSALDLEAGDVLASIGATKTPTAAAARAAIAALALGAKTEVVLLRAGAPVRFAAEVREEAGEPRLTLTAQR